MLGYMKRASKKSGNVLNYCKVLKKIIPVVFKNHINNYRKYLKQFGFLWKIRFMLRLYKTKRIEDLNRYKILDAEWEFILNGIALTKEVSFLKDKKFMDSYKKGVDNQIKKVFGHSNDYIIWRVHIATWFLSQALPPEGDFVECGVWYGWTSKSVIEYLDFENLNRNFYLIDFWNMEENKPGGKKSFSKSYYDPLSQKIDSNYPVTRTKKEKVEKTGGGGVKQAVDNSNLFQFVKQRFPYKNVNLIQGWIPDIFYSADFPIIEKIAYLHIDLNGNNAEFFTLEYFYPKLVKGGILIFDDYGHGFEGLAEMVDEFFSDKPEKPFYFACGSLVVVKQ